MFYTFDGSLARLKSQFEAMRALPREVGEELFVPRPQVSGWSVGEHLDHCARVSGGILQKIAGDEPIELRGINTIGRVILACGWIPRGKGRSPEPLRGTVVAAEALDASWQAAGNILLQIADKPPRERSRPLIKHPVFGGLRAAEAMRFIVVHNHHHLRIIREVAQAGGHQVKV